MLEFISDCLHIKFSIWFKNYNRRFWLFWPRIIICVFFVFKCWHLELNQFFSLRCNSIESWILPISCRMNSSRTTSKLLITDQKRTVGDLSCLFSCYFPFSPHLAILKNQFLNSCLISFAFIAVLLFLTLHLL